MIRIDKFLSKCLDISRKDAKSLIKQKLIFINDVLCKNDDTQIDELNDKIRYNEEPLVYKEFVYYMLNKPEGVISATFDNFHKTVVDLIDTKKEIFPIGRLDIDTTGLLILTNDGALSHDLLSPKHHVDKTYYVDIDKELSEKDITTLEEGIILDGKLTEKSLIKKISDSKYSITIHEGKFHQVKRMMNYVGAIVLALKRVKFGPLLLDESLEPGSYRELTEEEISLLKTK